MLSTYIVALKNDWLEKNDCPIKSLIDYMRRQNKMRMAQIEALEVYLYLKIVCQNKPLWQLHSEGLFVDRSYGTNTFFVSHDARQYIKQTPAAHALFDYLTQGGKQHQIAVAQYVLNNDCEQLFRDIFYGVSYPDYLFSLPMGAGKTYLMAAMIYLDLYFAKNEPSNPHFAHNFLVLIPSGLKSSITDSLRDIANFDGSWILPSENAAAIKQQLKFDVLDVPKANRKSNKTIDPNASKVNDVLPDPFGQIFVVNAEKVILNRQDKSVLFEKEELPNDLRCKIAEIPNLSIMMDEAHHTAKTTIRLRQVVNWWAGNNDHHGDVVNVLSFTGTPYLSSAEKLQVDTITHKSPIISNTVYYYPLINAVKHFLKYPTVKSANIERTEIIKKAIHDFEEKYGCVTYANSAIAKCAIYCSSIDTLETIVYPCLLNLGIRDDIILKYHKGNKEHKLPSQNTTAFRQLDAPESPYRYILLVQIGKEGWNCKSLAAVVLSGEGDSPKNMVLQTCCRCLRQVDGDDNTALIWLNDSNANKLNEQLRKEQKTSICELNALIDATDENSVERYSRIATLKLPDIDFYQLRIRHTTTDEEEHPHTAEKLQSVLENIEAYRQTVVIEQGDLEQTTQYRLLSEYEAGDALTFSSWMATIAKCSFGFTKLANLLPYEAILKKIHDTISRADALDSRYNIFRLNNDIALAFSVKRTLYSEVETISKQASLLLEQRLQPVVDTPALYPDRLGTTQLLAADNDPTYIKEFASRQKENIIKLVQTDNMDAVQTLAGQRLHSAVPHKDRSFHYVPYNFTQSQFEKTILEQALSLQTAHHFEIYYNGERGLTEFFIDCFERKNNRYKYLGHYTPDFLLIKRDVKKRTVHKVLILETKGAGYAHDPVFNAKKHFVSGEFIIANNEKFGYNRFDFLYLQDDEDINRSLEKITSSINTFFTENNLAN